LSGGYGKDLEYDWIKGCFLGAISNRITAQDGSGGKGPLALISHSRVALPHLLNGWFLLFAGFRCCFLSRVPCSNPRCFYLPLTEWAAAKPKDRNPPGATKPQRDWSSVYTVIESGEWGSAQRRTRQISKTLRVCLAFEYVLRITRDLSRLALY
jgi:hypothetical protein